MFLQIMTIQSKVFLESFQPKTAKNTKKQKKMKTKTVLSVQIIEGEDTDIQALRTTKIQPMTILAMEVLGLAMRG